MVGVPGGRSKGCITCRKRKIGCDQRRPGCLKCQQSGWVCEGYQPYPHFINQSFQGVQRQEEVYVVDPQLLATTDQRHIVPLAPAPAPYMTISSATPQYIDDTRALDDRFTALFIEKYVPADGNATRTLWSNSWFSEAFQLPEKGLILRLSLKAVCMTRVGLLRNDLELVQRGQDVYGRALGQFQRALNDETQMWSDQTLAAGAALQFYELYEFTSSSIRSWNSHVEGLSRLIQLRGPSKHHSRLAKAIMESNRYNAMIQNIQSRRSSFWANTEWQTQPWYGNSKDIIQKLYDSGFAIASVMEQYDNLAASDGAESTQILVDLLDQCSAMDEAFTAWHTEAKNIFPPRMHWATEPASGINSSGGWDGDYPSFEFACPETASTLMSFWALQLLLNVMASAIGNRLRTEIENNLRDATKPATGKRAGTTRKGKRSTSPSPMLQKAKRMAQRYTDTRSINLATNILRSMPYIMADEQELSGPQSSIFAIHVALFAFQRDPATVHELGLCRQWVAQLSLQKELRYAREIAKVGSDILGCSTMDTPLSFVAL